MSALAPGRRSPVARFALATLALGALVLGGCNKKAPAPDHLSAGGQAFLAQCAVCHGVNGEGDGPLASGVVARGSVAPANLTDRARITALGRFGVRAIMMGGGAHSGRSSAMPFWGPYLGDSLGDLITAYVLTLPRQGAAERALVARYLEPPPGSPPDGRRAYVLYCSGCHGAWGRGDGFFAPSMRRTLKPADLTAPPVAALDEKALEERVGMRGAHAPNAPTMPGWIDLIDDANVNEIAGYLAALARAPARP